MNVASLEKTKLFPCLIVPCLLNGMTMKREGAPQDDDAKSAEAPADGTSPTLLEKKWGKAVDSGFVAIPNVLLTNYHELNITPTEFVVMLNIMLHWWSVENKPFPRVSTIARRLGTSSRTVQRALNHLRNSGLLSWEKVQVLSGKIIRNGAPGEGTRRRIYNLEPLVQRAQNLAEARMKLMGSPPNDRGHHEIAA
jgi:AraC-like DNA-binding protein